MSFTGSYTEDEPILFLPWPAESSWSLSHPTEFHIRAAVSKLFHKHFDEKEQQLQ